MGSEILSNGCNDVRLRQASRLPYNDNEKHWIVQKFGGTSVGKFVDEIAQNIVK